MTVVISEFEVVPEREPDVTQSAAAAKPGDAVPQPPATKDVARLSQLLAERALRVWAS